MAPDKGVAFGGRIKTALPFELDEAQNWSLLIGYAESLSRSLNVPIDVAYHAKRKEFGGQRNDHGHLLLATRVWDDESKEFGRKTRELDVPETGSKIVRAMRKNWEQAVNMALPDWCSTKVSCAPVREQRPGFLVRRHLGKYASEADRRGLGTPEGAYNDLAGEHNELVVEIAEEELEIERVKRRIAQVQGPHIPDEMPILPTPDRRTESQQMREKIELDEHETSTMEM